jgi:hypothetical protein
LYTFHNAAQLSARLAVTELLVFWDGFNETPRSIKHFKMISFRPPAEKIHFKTYVANHSKLRLSLNIRFLKACLNAAGFV